MRLLRCLQSGGFKLTSFDDDNPPLYAILSHTWVEGQEVTYNDMVDGTGTEKRGYHKIRFCSDQAAADGYDYIWVDTCCINKSDSQELSTAINSMFRWYQGAATCYVYLLDVSLPDEVTDAKELPAEWLGAFRRSRWFTRGWTLQELIAPAKVEFFCKQSRCLGSKASLEQEIHEITQIPIDALRGSSLAKFGVEDRIGWAARRTTTLKEDRVYCLLGIFGVFLPLIYGEGEAYAELRLREEIQRRQEGRGVDNSRDLSIFSSLSFPRDELFVGRIDELWSLEQSLLRSHTHRRITIYGLGGCGKSALANEFAYRAMSKRARLVFWVLAISQESFELAYREIGTRLNIPEIDNNNADVKKLVQDYLASDRAGRWLMIVDNADDQDVLLGIANSSSKSVRLIDYLPRSNKGAVLFTTRSKKAAVALTQDSVLGLTDFGKSEARQLLSHRLTDLALLNDEMAVDELLEMLTYLPLAVVQAAAFMNNNSVSVTGYISLFREAGANAELFHEPFADPGRYEELDSTIARTWHISFDQICKQDLLAAQYLSFMACINRVNIPQSLVAGKSSLVQQTKALGTLTGYAFLTERQQTEETGEGRCFDMHRLVHMASVWWLDRHNKRTAWEDTAAARLMELLPYGDYKNMQVWSSYLPHATHVARSCSVVDTAVGALLLNRVGRCQTSLGQHAAAEMTHRQALSVNKEVLGPEHPDTLVSMHELGEAVYNRGKYAEAERVHLETLALRKKVLGDECVGTLRSMNNLAVALSSQGKYIEAEALHHEVLRLKRKVLGEEHPSTLKSVNNLAEVLGGQGKYAEAEEAHREVLRLRRKMFGEGHPDTLNSMSNLAGALSAQGKYAEAEEIGRKTLDLRLKLLGDKHPNTLLSMSNLAFVFAKQLRFDEARCMYEQAYFGYNTVLGEDHPWTRTCHQLYDDLALQERDWISAEKKVEAKENGSDAGDKTGAPAALPSVETPAIHLPSRPVLDDGETTNLSATSIKRSGWRNSPTLSFIKSRGVRGVANLLQRRTSLPESRK